MDKVRQLTIDWGIMVDNQGVATSGDWLGILKQKWYALIDKLNLSTDSTTSIALYAGIGFLTGFVCKKASSYVLVALLVLLGIAVLHQYNVINITVNWDEMSALLDIRPTDMTGDGLATIMWEWIKANAVISASYAVGFIIGFRLG